MLGLRLCGVTVALEWVVLAVLVAFFVGLYLGCIAMADHLGRDHDEDDSDDEEW